MERSAIAEALSNATRICVGVRNIDFSKSMEDYSISSLDRAEILSMTTRALRVRVAFAQLFKAANIAELVDVIYAAAHATDLSAPPA